MSLIGIMKARSNKLGEVQALRAIAAGFVALGHCLDYGNAAAATGRPPDNWSSLGASGVDLFFVISGFIIAKTALEPKPAPSTGDFLLRRAIRILPSYWIWSLIALLLATLRGLHVETASILKTFTFFTTADQTLYSVPVLYAGWTLSYELLFYATIGILLLLGLRSAWCPALLACAMAGASGLLSQGPCWQRFLANPLWLEFATGVLLWRYHGRLRRLPTTASLALLGGGTLLLLSSLPFAPGLADIQSTVGGATAWLRVGLWGGAAALVFAGTMALGPVLASHTAFLARLGDASYSWYLTQLLVIPLAARLWRLAWPAAPWPFFTLFCLSLTAAFAVLTYRFLEKPLNDSLCARLKGAAR